jgi:hypothetical protein
MSTIRFQALREASTRKANKFEEPVENQFFSVQMF